MRNKRYKWLNEKEGALQAMNKSRLIEDPRDKANLEDIVKRAKVFDKDLILFAAYLGKQAEKKKRRTE